MCINCQHNTAGQRCESCTKGYYREPGKNLNDADVCTPCGCAGPGVRSGKQDCVKVMNCASVCSVTIVIQMLVREMVRLSGEM